MPALTPFSWPLFKKKAPVIGIALGGGAARGIAHLGVLLALEELNAPIHMISGVSSGALIGGLYAAGVPVKSLISRLSSLNWRSFTSFHLSKRGMVSSARIQALVESFVGKIEVQQCPIPFLPVATNICSGESRVFYQSAHRLSVVIRASVSFPGVYPPVPIDDGHYIDGGVNQNVPVAPLIDHGATQTVGVDVIPHLTIDNVPTHIPLIVDRALDLMLVNQHRHNPAPDLLLCPLTSQVSSFDMKAYHQLVEWGYQSVMAHRAWFGQWRQ